MSQSSYSCVPMQGSGSFAIESVLTTTVPRNGGKVRTCAVCTVVKFNMFAFHLLFNVMLNVCARQVVFCYLTMFTL